MRAEEFLLSIIQQQLAAAEQTWLWNKSDFQKNKLGAKKTLFYSNWIGLAIEIIFLYYVYPLTHVMCTSYIYLYCHP